MAGNSRTINRVFTQSVINELIQNGKNEAFDYVVNQYIIDPQNKTYGQLFQEIYAHLSKEKRNEYYYQNTLLNKLLLGIHSVNTTTALSQVRVADHIADFVMINGEARVYEIKSELDNYDRLYEQLSDYFKAFSYVSVLSPVHELKRVEQMLDHLGDMGSAVGIYVLTKRDTIFNKSYGREPKKFDCYLEHSHIFNLLRKQEYESVLLSYWGEIPEVAPVFYYRTCLQQFKKIPIDISQDLALKALKNRNRINKKAFEDLQTELKSIVYFSRLSRKLPEVESFLQKTYRR